MALDHHYALRENTRLRQYAIGRLLGHGGFGLTYLALHTHLNKMVAIKELFPQDFAVRARDQETLAPRSSDQAENLEWSRRRFLDEARTLAALHHHAILPVHDFFEENGTAYMVTEFIEGENFESWLKLNEKPPEAALRAILVELLDALEIVHEKEFLHRDIKTENIIIERKSGKPVLIDFGNARVATGLKTSNLTAVLTPGYAPFEQYTSKGRQGPWTDIYAIGAVFYRAITGRAPEDSADRMQGDSMAPLASLGLTGYRQGFLASIDRALKLRPEDRWQSVREWKSHLGTVVAPTPEVRPSSKTPVIIAASAVLILALGAGVYAMMGPKPAPGHDNPPAADSGTAQADDAAKEKAAKETAETARKIQEQKDAETAKIKAEKDAAAAAEKKKAEDAANAAAKEKAAKGTGLAVDPPQSPQAVTLAHPFSNTLGMDFVPIAITDGGVPTGKRIFISVLETRVQDYAAVMGPVAGQAGGLPVANVSLKDAKLFCEKLSQKEGNGRRYRLPTDHEWSCAVGLAEPVKGEPSKKAGMPGRLLYPWGNTFNPAAQGVANIGSFLPGGGPGTLLAADKYPPNEFGVKNLGGGVRELCDTVFQEEKRYSNGSVEKPLKYVVRGSSFESQLMTIQGDPYEKLRSDFRTGVEPDVNISDIGFRCVLETTP